MKTISMKTNPAFKRAQLLPMLTSVPRAPSGRRGDERFRIHSAAGDLRRKMTDLAVCAMSVSQGFNAPAMRLTN